MIGSIVFAGRMLRKFPMKDDREALLTRVNLGRAVHHSREAIEKGKRVLSSRDREKIEALVEELVKIRARLVIEEEDG